MRSSRAIWAFSMRTGFEERIARCGSADAHEPDLRELGSDHRIIDRRQKSSVTFRTLNRSTIVFNKTPRFRDESGTLAGRILFLQFVRSLKGREDVTVYARLRTELPRILLWAVQ